MKLITFDRFVELCFKTTLGYFVFWFAFASVPFIKTVVANNDTLKQYFSQENYLVIAETSVKIEVADSKSERERGLSGQEYIDSDQGLYFIYEDTDYHGIWMKEMKFAIDIIWISDNQEVVHIEKGIKPETFPKVFEPKIPARYVLEVGSGFVKRNGIKLGDLVTQF